MAIKKYGPTTPGRRGMTVTDYSGIQRKPDFPSEWFCRRLYGQKDDRSTGTADVRTEQHGQPERHERLPDVSLAGKRGKKTGAGKFSPLLAFLYLTALRFRSHRRLQHSMPCSLPASDKP